MYIDYFTFSLLYCVFKCLEMWTFEEGVHALTKKHHILQVVQQNCLIYMCGGSS